MFHIDPDRLRDARALALFVASVCVLPFTATAQPSYSSQRSSPVSVSSSVMAVGERAVYDVHLAGRTVGTGSLEILGYEQVDGHTTLHAALQLQGSLLFARVNDRFDTWMDPARIFSRRFVQEQSELGRDRRKWYDFSPEQLTYVEKHTGVVDRLASREPLDDVSFLYFVRTMPLHVGDVDTIPRYFKQGHPVIVRVLRKETVTVPAGTFQTIVVQPTIANAGGLFGQGGRAEVYLTDDAARSVVMLKSQVPVLGALTLRLRGLYSGS